MKKRQSAVCFFAPFGIALTESMAYWPTQEQSRCAQEPDDAKAPVGRRGLGKIAR